METLQAVVRRFEDCYLKPLRKEKHLPADTRIPEISLYDHLVLTAAFSVVMVKELFHRGKRPEDICGLSLSEREVLALARLGGLAHDIGKAKAGAMDYRGHAERSVEMMGPLLREWGMDEQVLDVLLDAIAKHHYRSGPTSILAKVICLADSYASAGDRWKLAKGETKEELQQMAESMQKLEMELFDEDLPVVLLMADVDAVKSYVYETRTLPEIRGGSEILQDVEEAIREKFEGDLSKECVLYCGGGGLLAVLPATEGDVWVREIERLYLEKTRVVTATVVVSRPVGYRGIFRGLFPQDAESLQALSGKGVAQDLLYSHFEALSSNRVERKNFGELVAKLASELQWEKRKKQYVPFFETFPIHARCTSCGKRPGVQEDLEDLLCEVCLMKRKRGREERRYFLEDFVRFLEETENVSIPIQRENGELRYPKDIETLLGKEEGHIALLYADGNNMGDVLQRVPSPAIYRHFSEALERATKESLFSALWDTFGEKKLCDTGKSLPFEIIALGGDDLVVIVPGNAGWTLALAFLEAFENHEDIRELQKEIDKYFPEPLKLSMSLGLAIADSKYPVGFLLHLAEGLLKRAKRLARERKEGTLCHLWLRSPVLAEEVDGLLQALYVREKVELTARPYTLGEAKHLTGIVRQLESLGIGRSQLRDFAEVLEWGVHASLNFVLYQVARVSSEQRRKDMLQVLRALGALLGEKEMSRECSFFWVRGRDRWKTALLDALELFELGVLEYPGGGEHGGHSAR